MKLLLSRHPPTGISDSAFHDVLFLPGSATTIFNVNRSDVN
jgi:hypothetical protein